VANDGSAREAGVTVLRVTSPHSIDQVLRRYADAWTAGDLATVLDAYHPDFTLHYFGTSPLAGTHAGRDAALKVLAEATARTDRSLVEVVDVLGGADLGALVVVERLGRDGDAREVRRVLLYRTQHDKLLECWLYDEDQPFVDRLWSVPPP
jgi:ketosteroid isomerase-like protein